MISDGLFGTCGLCALLAERHSCSGSSFFINVSANRRCLEKNLVHHLVLHSAAFTSAAVLRRMMAYNELKSVVIVESVAWVE
jgi:hypothetical protein